MPLGRTTRRISATAGRIWDELKYEHGESAIEGIILERQDTGIRLLEADPRVGIAGTRELHIGFGQVNSGDARYIGDFRRANAKLPVPQPTSSTRSSSKDRQIGSAEARVGGSIFP